METSDFTYEKLMEVQEELTRSPAPPLVIKEVKRRSDLTKQINEDLAKIPKEVREKAIDLLLAVQGMYDGWGIC